MGVESSAAPTAPAHDEAITGSSPRARSVNADASRRLPYVCDQAYRAMAAKRCIGVWVGAGDRGGELGEGRHRPDGDDAGHKELGCIGLGDLSGEQRGLASLRVAQDDHRVGRGRPFEAARRPSCIQDPLGLALTHEVGLQPVVPRPW